MDAVTIIRSKTRRSVSLQVLPDLTVVVKAPLRFPEKKIQQMLADHADWIYKKQQAFRERNVLREEDTYWYLGKTYPVEIRLQQQQIIEFAEKFYLASSNKSYFSTYVTSWYKQQAKQVISERVHLYAKKQSLFFTSITLTSAETRWGSCSTDKHLCFNWRLIMAPLEVIDYVVTHELAHLTEMNHSADFWETVRKMYPVYREHRTWLKRYGHLLRV